MWGKWGVTAAMERNGRHGEAGIAADRAPAGRKLWVEDPVGKRRMADPVRTAAVRAVLVVSLTMIQAMIAFLCTLTGSWLAFPMVIGGVLGTVVSTWAVLDVWVTRQVWLQRNGVRSEPSSSARALRRERRRAARAARAAARSGGSIPGPASPGGAEGPGATGRVSASRTGAAGRPSGQRVSGTRAA
jgi:hypothetical protein